ncbi:hypothetical protein H9Y04_02275 [Streptomyces sp. TRM66268-LWL]|uniref:Uncharacterized protein n=1 Tax=Streptomyces polyasparticus TaxID=2767826 RepID=A0ABR7S7E3_9ACTN|nr:hypothetical protein [Streptomyces polyasparticus]MBC9711397.1 hypothetical protein [Streptomyces polyasparticus]
MIRSDLESALARDAGPSARAARLALHGGANFELLSEGHHATSAQQLWATWALRHQAMLETGVVPPPGQAEAVDELQAAGTSLVHLAKIVSPQRRFVVSLAEDLTRCIACMG